MKATKHKFFSFLVLTSLIWGASSQAYPIVLNIYNPRAHSLFVVSETERFTIEIPALTFRELKVFCKSDWRVRYSTGAAGVFKWTLDKELDHFVTECKNVIGDNALSTTLKYCDLQLDEIQKPAGYALIVTAVRDLKIAVAEQDECKLGKNELSLKLIPISQAHTPFANNVLQAAGVLFSRPIAGRK